jgi:hypothetical protein
VPNATRQQLAASTSFLAVLAALLALVLAAPASAAVPGLELKVGGSGPPDSDPSNTATADCPEGKGLLGLGGKYERAGGQVVLDAIAPENETVIVRGSEDEDGTNARWNVRAYAICADQGASRNTTNNEPVTWLVPNTPRSRGTAVSAGASPASGARSRSAQTARSCSTA